jgi:DNA-binding NarL/FixJ family response regulator
LRAGAAGYLMKSSGLEELLEALRRVAAGERYVSPDLAAELINAGLRPLPDDPALVPELAALTNREIQILRLIGRGHSTSMIARELGISAKTVGAHRENLKNKLDTNSSAELARRAFQLVENRVL